MKPLDLRAQSVASRIPFRSSEGKLALGLGACAALIEAGLLLISSLDRPASHVPDYITYYLLVSLAYVTACWLVTRNSDSLAQTRSLRWIWAVALLFRLTVLPLDASLSEDTARYRWQGMVQHVGGDPYTAVPEDASWDGLRDATWPRIAGKDKPSAYGPVLEQFNLWYYRFVSQWEADPWRQVWFFKVPLALADLAVGWALVGLLSSLGRPRTWVLVYLWSPLAVTEFWMEGHNDALAAFLVVVALTLSARKRPTWALAALSVAMMCKFWPAVLFPFLLLTKTNGRWRVQWRGALASLSVLLALCLPYWRSIASVIETLEGFAGGWRNNDSLFAVFLELTGGDMSAAADVSQWAVILAIVALRLLPLPALGGELAAICAVLLVSANCFPWYLTWMLPLVAVHPSAPLLLWTALVSLAYHVIPGYEATGSWEYDRALIGLEYIPVLLWMGIIGACRIRRPLQAAIGRMVARTPSAGIK